MSTRSYRITIEGRSYDVEVGDISGGTVTVTVDGVPYEVDVPTGGPTAAASAPAAGPARSTAPVQRPAAPPRPSAQSAAGGNDIRAMMPGRVISVSVKPGDSVKRGQPLLVIESMKMENTIASPRDGRVRAVHVGEGVAVQHGQSLIEFE